eukprot:scaffold631725_cov32-Prasinocladus_malaysianus.AAC.1
MGVSGSSFVTIGDHFRDACVWRSGGVCGGSDCPDTALDISCMEPDSPANFVIWAIRVQAFQK